MPRYTKKKRKGEFKTLKSVHQHALLGSLDDEDWKLIQKVAADRTKHHKHVHPGAYKDLAKGGRLGVLWAVSEEQKARRRGEYVGGGLVDALTSVGKTIWKMGSTPFKVAWHSAQNFTYPLFHDNSISTHTNLVATALSESYELDESLRADYIGPLIRDQELSTKFLDVWIDEHRNPPYALISVRGSKNAEDFLVDDVAILASGRTPRNLIQSDLKRAVEKYADAGTVEVASHSLGTTLVAQSLESDPTLLEKIDRVDYFNPASSPLFESVVSEFSQNDKSFFFENQADLVGLGQMIYSSPPKNLTMLSIKSLNPMTNHGVAQWMPETKIETGQLDDSATKNLQDPKAGWAEADAFEEKDP